MCFSPDAPSYSSLFYSDEGREGLDVFFLFSDSDTVCNVCNFEGDAGSADGSMVSLWFSSGTVLPWRAGASGSNLKDCCLKDLRPVIFMYYLSYACVAFVPPSSSSGASSINESSSSRASLLKFYCFMSSYSSASCFALFML